MFHILPESEGNILGLRATGKLTEQDYKGTASQPGKPAQTTRQNPPTLHP